MTSDWPSPPSVWPHVGGCDQNRLDWIADCGSLFAPDGSCTPARSSAAMTAYLEGLTMKRSRQGSLQKQNSTPPWA
jgi:hypothetical protein